MVFERVKADRTAGVQAVAVEVLLSLVSTRRKMPPTRVAGAFSTKIRREAQGEHWTTDRFHRATW